MADVISTTDPTTLGLLNLAGLIIAGGDNSAFIQAVNDMENTIGFSMPEGVTFTTMTDAGPPPETTTFGSDSAAFQAWLASLS